MFSHKNRFLGHLETDLSIIFIVYHPKIKPVSCRKSLDGYLGNDAKGTRWCLNYNC